MANQRAGYGGQAVLVSVLVLVLEAFLPRINELPTI